MSNPVHFHWKDPSPAGRFRTGVSLHSHTLHSRESLDFVPRMGRHVPPMRWQAGRFQTRFQRVHGHPFIFEKGWWTPPLDAAGAYAVESGQIAKLGLRPLVSLTDHDAFAGQAGMASVELTVQLAPGSLHLGIHNLPPQRANEVLAYRAQPAVLMEWLSQFPHVLVVLNHPLWDEGGSDEATHRGVAERFLAQYGSGVHSLELNGMRPWRENQRVMEMAQTWGFPTISGGDRHGFEPNANINLTNAETFDEFVDEIRRWRMSSVLFLAQYRIPLQVRVARDVLAVLRDQPHHPLGWRRLEDRVFYEPQPGVVRSIAELFPEGMPRLVPAISETSV